jgi:signal transduction histidine kinase
MNALIFLAGALAAGVPLGIAVARARSRLRGMDERARALAEDHERRAQARLAFLGSMAHELRTPLTAILGYQELLADGIYGEFDDRTTEAIRRIGRATGQLGHLIDGMVELAAEGLARELDLEQLVPQTALRPYLDDAAVTARDAGLEFRVEIEEVLPTLVTDARRLERVLFLSLYASIRATSSGALTVRMHPRAAANGRPGLEVAIHGTALPPSALPDREPGAHAHGQGHAGPASLRLTIARETARYLGGDVVLEDGTVRFWVEGQ